VVLLESAGQLGGRARTIHYRGADIDNGQHLILGAYRETLRLLNILGVHEQQVFDRHPLQLQMRQAGQADTKFNFPSLPAPLHALFGLAMAEGLSINDRWHALKMCFSLISIRHNIKTDISVHEFLRKKGQGDKLINTLWQPLCLAVLNTPLEIASAEIFIKSLKDAFVRKRSDSDLLYACSNLGSILPEPAHRYLEHQGGIVKLQHRVIRLIIENNKISGVELSGGDTMYADYVIMAVPPSTCKDLLAPHEAMGQVLANLSQIENAPICTVYVQYPPTIGLTLPMIGLIGTIGQWVFDRARYGQAGLMAVVISSEGSHMQLDNDALRIQVINELSRVFPDWPEPVESYVIRERRATFLCRTGINAIRPATRTPVSGCLLAGDYTATGYPATLEGAVRSGIKAAQYIINSNSD